MLSPCSYYHDEGGTTRPLDPPNSPRHEVKTCHLATMTSPWAKRVHMARCVKKGFTPEKRAVLYMLRRNQRYPTSVLVFYIRSYRKKMKEAWLGNVCCFSWLDVRYPPLVAPSILEDQLSITHTHMYVYIYIWYIYICIIYIYMYIIYVNIYVSYIYYIYYIYIYVSNIYILYYIIYMCYIIYWARKLWDLSDGRWRWTEDTPKSSIQGPFIKSSQIKLAKTSCTTHR